MCVGSLECPGRRSLHCSGVCLPESSAAVHVCVGRSIGRDNKINKLWQAGRSRDIPFHNSVQQFDCSSPHLLSSKEKPLFSLGFIPFVSSLIPQKALFKSCSQSCNDCVNICILYLCIDTCTVMLHLDDPWPCNLKTCSLSCGDYFNYAVILIVLIWKVFFLHQHNISYTCSYSWGKYFLCLCRQSTFCLRIIVRTTI